MFANSNQFYLKIHNLVTIWCSKVAHGNAASINFPSESFIGGVYDIGYVPIIFLPVCLCHFIQVANILILLAYRRSYHNPLMNINYIDRRPLKILFRYYYFRYLPQTKRHTCTILYASLAMVDVLFTMKR